jgi:hypothetical protein
MLRTDLWAAAFIRRHNDLGHLCVVSRRGDPIAGQIFLEVDHLNGTASLYTPAPTALRGDSEDRLFQRRFDRVEPSMIGARIERERDFDPDLWVITLEMREDDPGITLVAG